MSEEETLRIENAQAGIDAAGDRETPSPPVLGSDEFVIASLRTKLEEKDDRIQELNGKIANLEYDLKNCENGYNMAIQNEAVSRAISDELRDLLKIALKK